MLKLNYRLLNYCLMYKPKTENFCEDFNNEKSHLNSANIQYIHSIMAVYLVVGKMKDETWYMSIKGFAGLKVKMYTYITKNEHECKKAKNINSCS